MNKLLPSLRLVDSEVGISYLQTVVNYVICMSRSENRLEVINMFKRALSEEPASWDFDIFEELRKDALQKIHQEVRQEGRQEAARQIAAKLLDEGLEPQLIANTTQLPLTLLLEPQKTTMA